MSINIGESFQPEKKTSLQRSNIRIFRIGIALLEVKERKKTEDIYTHKRILHFRPEVKQRKVNRTQTIKQKISNENLYGRKQEREKKKENDGVSLVISMIEGRSDLAA